MSPQQAIEYFGSQKALAEAVARTQPTVAGWLKNDQIPVPIQYQIHLLTGGKLRVNP